MKIVYYFQHSSFRDYIVWKYAQAVLTARSLTYNEHMSQSYAIDFLLEPIFWFVDNFANYLGKVSTTFKYVHV